MSGVELLDPPAGGNKFDHARHVPFLLLHSMQTHEKHTFWIDKREKEALPEIRVKCLCGGRLTCVCLAAAAGAMPSCCLATLGRWNGMTGLLGRLAGLLAKVLWGPALLGESHGRRCLLRPLGWVRKFGVRLDTHPQIL